MLDLSRLKRIQVIVSTHSPYILEELPAESRVLILPSADGPNVVYGASPEFALSRIDDAVHPEAFVYVEDTTAQVFVREILASHPDGGELLPRIKISPVGPANVVSLMGQLAVEGRLPHRSISILDGDMENSRGCVKLPGDGAPERVVFEGLRAANWCNLAARFGIGAGTLYQDLEDVILTPDHHTWTTQIGDRVIKSARSVWEIICSEWCKVCLDENDRTALIQAIQATLNQQR